MFISFDIFALLFWIVVTSFLPGALLMLGLLNSRNELRTFEKIIAGAGFGLVVPSFFSFLLFFAGIKYSFSTAVISVLAFYVLALFFFVRSKAYENIKLPSLALNFSSSISILIPVGMIALMVLAFLLRIQSLSPIYYEFDPYYYVYTTQQLLLFGENPINDGTAWYPEMQVSHRVATTLSYMEAIWYSFYMQGGNYNNYVLSLIGNSYPPIAAAFTIFFMYLMVASNYRRSYALLGAAISSFVPIFFLKFAAGEMEVQPYAFMTLTMFLSFYAFAFKTNDRIFAILAAIAYAALSLGSASEIVALTLVIIAVPVYSLLMFFKDKAASQMREFLILNGIIFVFGNFLGGSVLKFLFQINSSLLPNYVLAFGGSLAFSALLYYLKEKVKDLEMAVYIFAGLLIIGGLAIAFTPLGVAVREIASSGLSFAQFTTSLQRTIAEQGTTGAFFEGQLGALGSDFGGQLLNIVFVPFSFVANLFFRLFASVSSLFSGVSVDFEDKPPSLLMTFLGLLITVSIYELYKILAKNEKNHVLLFAILILPIAMVGLTKAKFTIYLGVLLPGVLGAILGETEDGIKRLLKKAGIEIQALPELSLNAVHVALLLIVSMLAVAQYNSLSGATDLLFFSFTPKFQDAPAALQQKFSLLCGQLRLSGGYDEDVCSAGSDPLGYASKGIRYQYNRKLCLLSHYSNPLNPTGAEQNVAAFRCNTINDYWLEAMEFIRHQTEPASRTTSWWDYGHWINFFGQKNTVLRNEHASLPMILEVANAYIDGTPEELADFMRKHDSKYVLFDGELLFGGSSFGGKYGALNYLSCVRNNESDVTRSPGSSICESEHLWETIYVPLKQENQQACRISEGNEGIIAYRSIIRETPQGLVRDAVPFYCIGKATLADSQETLATYSLDKKYENGDLKLNKGILKNEGDLDGNVRQFAILYTKENIWLENGEVKNGWEDRKGKFYDSNMYNAFVLENLKGFKKVFTSSGGEVKIYKLEE